MILQKRQVDDRRRLTLYAEAAAEEEKEYGKGMREFLTREN